MYRDLINNKACPSPKSLINYLFIKYLHNKNHNMKHDEIIQ